MPVPQHSPSTHGTPMLGRDRQAVLLERLGILPDFDSLRSAPSLEEALEHLKAALTPYLAVEAQSLADLSQDDQDAIYEVLGIGADIVERLAQMPRSTPTERTSAQSAALEAMLLARACERVSASLNWIPH